MLDTRGLVIGELSVREKILTREQLDALVSLQQGRGYSQPLGALMIEKGFVTHDRLESLLRRQRQALADYERDLSVSGLFGRIAIERGFITEKDLAQAIRQQLEFDFAGKRLKIGQILIRIKAMTPVQFWEIIHAQGLFKCGACGHVLDTPRLEGTSLFCEKCGKQALSLDE